MKDKPAFPQPMEMRATESLYFAGLTRRELFAAMAMQGICARPGGAQPYTEQYVVTWACQYADALIAELDK